MLRTLQFAAYLAGAVAFSNAAVAAEGDCPQKDLVEAGSFTAKITSVGFIIGARWGGGEVTLKDGIKRKFSLKGGKLMEIGANKAEMEGRVYNLKNPQAFAGTYIGLGGGATIVKGFGKYNLTNGDCTVISMKVKTSGGLQLSAPMLNGISISYTK
jgi:hypothetical protein